MKNKHAEIFSIFDRLRYLLMLYGHDPIDYMYDFHDDECIEITDQFVRAFNLFDDSFFKPLSRDKEILINELCGNDDCKKQLRLIYSLEDYILEHREHLLNLELWGKSPILSKYPEISNLLDDDYLFDLSQASFVSRDRVQYKADIFFYHPYIDFYFLREFERFCKDDASNCIKKIALDPRRILPAKDYPMKLLEAYWYGPKFNLQTVDKQIHGIELTVHSRTPDSPRNLFKLKLDRTEFMWSMRGNLKTFQVEEIIQKNGVESSEKTVAVRYIHTIRDTHQHAFIHLDGAIRSYSIDNYRSRFENKISNHPNSDDYFKLFRIDGAIQDQDWIDLVANFFSGNELIHEYFGQPMQEIGKRKLENY